MLHFGPLAFAQPWILTALLGLPLLWWLLRVTPPAPRTVRFPAIRLLFGLLPPEETPARTPWWLLLLRLLVALLIILGLAQPLLNPSARLSGSGPLMLVIDDGWAAARHWQSRQIVIDALLAQAEREGRPVVVLTTAPGELDEPAAVSGLLTASEARRRVQGERAHERGGSAGLPSAPDPRACGRGRRDHLGDDVELRRRGGGYRESR